VGWKRGLVYESGMSESGKFRVMSSVYSRGVSSVSSVSSVSTYFQRRSRLGTSVTPFHAKREWQLITHSLGMVTAGEHGIYRRCLPTSSTRNYISRIHGRRSKTSCTCSCCFLILCFKRSSAIARLSPDCRSPTLDRTSMHTLWGPGSFLRSRGFESGLGNTISPSTICTALQVTRCTSAIACCAHGCNLPNHRLSASSLLIRNAFCWNGTSFVSI
jgi:hypothetical protein